jgi:hypothetical protein
MGPNVAPVEDKKTELLKSIVKHRERIVEMKKNLLDGYEKLQIKKGASAEDVGRARVEVEEAEIALCLAQLELAKGPVVFP